MPTLGGTTIRMHPTSSSSSSYLTYCSSFVFFSSTQISHLSLANPLPLMPQVDVSPFTHSTRSAHGMDNGSKIFQCILVIHSSPRRNSELNDEPIRDDGQFGRMTVGVG